MTGTVTQNLGGDEGTPQVGAHITINVRSDDERKKIFDDLEKTRAANTFMVEGVEALADGTLKARWVSGAEENRHIEHYGIVGRGSVSFDNPKDDGPKTLRIDMGGADFTYNKRNEDGTYTNGIVIPYAELIARLKATVEAGGKFRVTQRVAQPALAVVVADQEALDTALYNFRNQGFSGCIARTFVKGTTNPDEIDVQSLYFPNDIPAKDGKPAVEHDIPQLEETKKFAALMERDDVITEIIPGNTMNIVKNPEDVTKSAAHKIVEGLIKGQSDGQKSLHAAQNYGPGIVIRAKKEDGTKLGALRFASRTDGPQVKGLMNIATAAFPNAADVVYTKKAEAEMAEKHDDSQTDDASDAAVPAMG
jgi:hypothetical protein